MHIQIKNRYDESVIFEGEFETLLLSVEEAVRKNANLYDANLYGANLRGANLRGANLYDANLYGANLRGANLCGANLYDANLYGANLRGANLCGANLYDANLRGANLYDANLYGANLRGANLCGAVNLNKYLTTPMYILKDQVGKIRAYKLVKENGEGPMNGGIKYEIGKIYNVDDANTDENENCSTGIHLAGLDWVMKEWKQGYKILIAEFTAEDIAAIPIGSDGKFRVFKCKIIKEKDLKELGLDGK
jgi:hypothetical protein